MQLETENKVILPLPSMLTMENIEEFFLEARKINISEGVHVEINAAELDSITTPGLQVLLSLARSVAQANGQFQIISAPPALKDACRVMGLDSEYDTWTRKE